MRVLVPLFLILIIPAASLAWAQVPCAAHAGGERLCPDLVVDPRDLGEHFIATRTFDASHCAVTEGSTVAGERRLLRFSFSSPNLGLGPLFIGRPADRPELFEWATCHQHWHYKEYADYRLWTMDAYANWTAARAASPGMPAAAIFEEHPELASGMIAGHKQGFCVMDLRPIVAAAPRNFAGCGNQGLSVGWADRYGYTLDGQWIDITGVAAGLYVLEAEVNAERIFEESEYANNAAATVVEVYPTW